MRNGPIHATFVPVHGFPAFMQECWVAPKLLNKLALPDYELQRDREIGALDDGPGHVVSWSKVVALLEQSVSRRKIPDGAVVYFNGEGEWAKIIARGPAHPDFTRVRDRTKRLFVKIAASPVLRTRKWIIYKVPEPTQADTGHLLDLLADTDGVALSLYPRSADVPHVYIDRGRELATAADVPLYGFINHRWHQTRADGMAPLDPTVFHEQAAEIAERVDHLVWWNEDAHYANRAYVEFETNDVIRKFRNAEAEAHGIAGASDWLAHLPLIESTYIDALGVIHASHNNEDDTMDTTPPQPEQPGDDPTQLYLGVVTFIPPSDQPHLNVMTQPINEIGTHERINEIMDGLDAVLPGWSRLKILQEVTVDPLDPIPGPCRGRWWLQGGDAEGSAMWIEWDGSNQTRPPSGSYGIVQAVGIGNTKSIIIHPGFMSVPDPNFVEMLRVVREAIIDHFVLIHDEPMDQP